jgi:hypothetical protein
MRAIQAVFGVFCIMALPYAATFLTVGHWSVWLPVMVLVIGGTVLVVRATENEQ